MSSTAITAQGIAIARFGTTAFETIPNVVSFQGPGGQAAVIDVTNLASTAKEKRVGGGRGAGKAKEKSVGSGRAPASVSSCHCHACTRWTAHANRSRMENKRTIRRPRGQ